MKYFLITLLLIFGGTLSFAQDFDQLIKTHPQYQFPENKVDYLWNWEKNRWPVYLKDDPTKFGYIDNNGKTVIPFQYDAAWKFYDDLALVKFKGKFGYIDRNGKVKIPFKYDDAGHFLHRTADVAILTKRGKNKGVLQWFQIDERGNNVKVNKN